MGILALCSSGLCVLVGIYLAWAEIRRTQRDAALVLLNEDEVEKGEMRSKRSPVIISFLFFSIICGVLLKCFINAGSPVIIIVPVIVLCFGILIDGRVTEFQKQKSVQEVEYFIPIIMERLVMAVEAGLDIIPAIKVLVDLEEKALGYLGKDSLDPVSALFKKVITLTERGIAFDEALKITSEEAIAYSIKHAFIHLAIAFKEGGELVSPLRELSDATQLHFQESVEEEIAKLPVKATLPLVVTFAGLMTFFLASPLVQIISFAEKAVPR